MIDINEVRERVSVLADWAVIGREHGDGLSALLDDHARLQADVLSMQEFIGPSLLSYWATAKKEAQP